MGTYVTELGFQKKRLPDIQSELEEAYRGIYGLDVTLSPESTNGQEIAVYSESLADVWDLVEVLYLAFTPQGSIGRVQELLYAINGITRNQAEVSTVDLEITGTPGKFVTLGFQAKNENNLTFETVEEGTIEPGGTVLLAAECTITGPNTALADTITQIVTPRPDITDVTNPDDAVPGRDQEKDSLFRLRRNLSVALPALNVIESLYSQLADVSGVTAVRLYQNRTGAVDSNGLLPHSFLAVIDGGDETELVDIIWKNTTAGIGSNGDELHYVLDPNGFSVEVRFQRPSFISVYIDITLDKSGQYPGDGDSQIRQNIINYAAGLLNEETGGFTGFSIGQDILLSRLYQPINLVQGHNITDLQIGESWGTLAPADIDIEFDEIGVFLAANIKINGVTP